MTRPATITRASDGTFMAQAVSRDPAGRIIASITQAFPTHAAAMNAVPRLLAWLAEPRAVPGGAAREAAAAGRGWGV